MKHTPEQLSLALKPDRIEVPQGVDPSESELSELFDEAAAQIGNRFETILAAEPIDRESAEELLNLLEWRLGSIDIEVDSEPGDEAALLTRQLEARYEQSRKVTTRKLSKEGISDQTERKRRYAIAKQEAREVALCGSDTKPPVSAVTRHWFSQGDNAERVLRKQQALEEQFQTLPARPLAA